MGQGLGPRRDGSALYASGFYKSAGEMGNWPRVTHSWLTKLLWSLLASPKQALLSLLTGTNGSLQQWWTGPLSSRGLAEASSQYSWHTEVSCLMSSRCWMKLCFEKTARSRVRSVSAEPVRSWGFFFAPRHAEYLNIFFFFLQTEQCTLSVTDGGGGESFFPPFILVWCHSGSPHLGYYR